MCCGEIRISSYVISGVGNYSGRVDIGSKFSYSMQTDRVGVNLFAESWKCRKVLRLEIKSVFGAAARMKEHVHI